LALTENSYYQYNGQGCIIFQIKAVSLPPPELQTLFFVLSSYHLETTIKSSLLASLFKQIAFSVKTAVHCFTWLF